MSVPSELVHYEAMAQALHDLMCGCGSEQHADLAEAEELLERYDEYALAYGWPEREF